MSSGFYTMSEADEVAQLTEGGRTPRLALARLRFSPDLESAFVEYHFQQSLTLIRLAAILAFVLYALFGVLDLSIVPEVAYDFIDVTCELLELAAAADCFCFGTLAQRGSTSRLTLHRLLDAAEKSVKLLDINLRKDCFFRETITESLTRADVLKLNLPEAHYLAELFEISLSSLPDFCAEMIEEWSLACCLVTLGEHGALAASAKGEQVYVPGYQVNVVDTCGSGDAFAAGFIHEYLGGKSLADCVRLGNALGTMIAMTRGATNPVSIEEVRHFLKAKHARFHEPSLQPFDVG